MASKIGTMIKSAREKAGLSQAELAKAVDGVSSADIGKAERGEKELSEAALKQIAKATGVTQKSLLEAAAGKKAAAKKPAVRTEAAKKPAAKTEAAKKPAEKKKASGKKEESAPAAKKKTTAKKPSSGDEIKLTKAEAELLALFREADDEKKKNVLTLLKEKEAAPASLLDSLLKGSGKETVLSIVTGLFGDKNS